MIKHIIKLVWNRRHSNFLIAVETFFSFLVLFFVTVMAVNYTDNYRRLLGFNYENVWNVEIDMKQVSDNDYTPEQMETVRQIYQALKAFGEVEAAAGALTSPFSDGESYGQLMISGREVEFRQNEVTDDFDKVMGVTLARGRWFSKEDDGANRRPVVINQRLAQGIFGDGDPVGRDIPQLNNQIRMRVIGVVTDFRHGGEFSSPENLVFYRTNLGDPADRPPRNLLVKLRSGTTRAFEEKLIRKLEGVARQWSFEIQPLIELRETDFRKRVIPIMLAGLVALFLMIMVALGLTGVLWLNVTQRSKEIGLRRADGATIRHIYQQILGELLIITSFGLIAGVAVVIQLPLFNITGRISGDIYVWSIVLSMAMIYLLTVICGLYPSWLATKAQPATALRHE